MQKIQKVGLVLVIIGLMYWIVNGVLAALKILPSTCSILGGHFVGLIVLFIIFIGLGLMIFNRFNWGNASKMSRVQKIVQILLLINVLFYGLGAYTIFRHAIDTSFFIILSAFILFSILLIGIQLLKGKLFNVTIWLGLILSSISILYVVYLAAISSF